MDDRETIFTNLRKKGYRITPQREKILEFFYQIPEGDHLSAEELQTLLQNNNIQISLATLYRTLKFLSENKLLRELDFGEDHKHYELTSENMHHHHLICTKCGLTIEFDDKKLSDFAQSVALEQNSFHVIDHQFKIFGHCKNCQESSSI